MTPETATGPSGRLGTLSTELKALRERLRLGGGPDSIDSHHAAGKLTARERLGLLLDTDAPTFELGLLYGCDDSGGGMSATGVVTCLGRVHDREVVVVASDATVEGGVWSRDTMGKILRAQEVAMRCRIPVVYLVDSQGLHAPVRGEVFPGQYGAGRALYYASVMRQHLAVPQLAAVMGSCVGSAAYLPALADVIVMVEGTSFLGLGDPQVVQEATGTEVGAEELGGARAQTEISGIAHYTADSEPACIDRLRRLVEDLPPGERPPPSRVATPPVRLSYELYDLVPDDPRQPYDMRAVLECLLDGDPFDEFQPDHAPEMICGTGFVEGVGVGVLANARGLFRPARGDAPRFGGLLYAESARKAAFFIETMNRHGTPLLFLQDVSGFMVGPEVEHEGIIRAGADLVEAMATACVPKVVVTLDHAFGAGYYAMAGQGFDPDFTVSLPTGRFGPSDDGADAPTGETLRAFQAAARGFVDELLLPEEVRPALGLLLRAGLRNPGPHLGPFQLG